MLTPEQLLLFATNAHALFEAQKDALAEIARRAVAKGETEATVLLFCIAVDSGWRPWVDHLAPHHDWQQYRDRGAAPVACGYFSRALWVEPLVNVVPAIASGLRRKPRRGVFSAVVCVTASAAVYDVRPRPEPS